MFPTSQTARTTHMVVQLRMWHMSMARPERRLGLVTLYGLLLASI